ncbi:hypothetical protein F7725_004130 [Dissostichus mawsoni]|uniref:Transmembrane ascorbate-dependent reductase CYB561 n=1 Tax=Dissostichus mawsoni TaxID=36200 RepID=A0A7J5YC62_DISMA|nr:hypothetical protein F7725_004130 [Dissostichus mawsoni]
MKGEEEGEEEGEEMEDVIRDRNRDKESYSCNDVVAMETLSSVTGASRKADLLSDSRKPSADRQRRAPGLRGAGGGAQVLGLASVVLTAVWMGHYRGGFSWDGSSFQFNVHPLCMVLGLVFLQGDAILVYRVFRNEAKRNVKILHGHPPARPRRQHRIVAVFDFHRAAKIPDMYSLHSLRHADHRLILVQGVLANVLGLVLVLFGVVLCYLITRKSSDVHPTQRKSLCPSTSRP